MEGWAAAASRLNTLREGMSAGGWGQGTGSAPRGFAGGVAGDAGGDLAALDLVLLKSLLHQAGAALLGDRCGGSKEGEAENGEQEQNGARANHCVLGMAQIFR